MINIKLTDILETGYNFTKNLPLGLNIASLLLFIFFSVAPFYFGSNSYEQSSYYVGAEQINLVPLKEGLPSDLTPNFKNLDTFGVSTEGVGIGVQKGKILIEGGALTGSDVNLLDFTQIEVLGHFLYTYASIFLIILSLILLLAMLAIIIISKKNIRNI
jgi:NADH-ubiquinone oxidoreductase chain 6